MLKTKDKNVLIQSCHYGANSKVLLEQATERKQKGRRFVTCTEIGMAEICFAGGQLVVGSVYVNDAGEHSGNTKYIKNNVYLSIESGVDGAMQ